MTAQNKDRPQKRTPTPDPADLEDLKKIRRVDLDLHSDGIDHWQDEPQPKGGKNEQEGKGEHGPDRGGKPG